MIKRIVLLVSDLLEKPFGVSETIDNRYDVIEFLGRGSYGNSYLVFDRLRNHECVLKALRIHKRFKRSHVKSFYHEQKLLKSINQKGFPRFFDQGNFKNIPYYTMEYIKGKTFEQTIFQEGIKYSEQEAFQKGYELLQLMNVLHLQGIIHRDIRIPNVILQGEQIKIIDFGLARKMSNHNSSSYDKKKVGREISPASDYYALGHFLLFLLYSDYHPRPGMKEKSWEEELVLSKKSREIIKKLLFIDQTYSSFEEINDDFMKNILNLEERKCVI